jgi:uncharacterized membrane protein YccF (DUF307 family)
MQPVSILLNLLWILCGGAWMAFGWLVAAVVMAITIIGLPCCCRSGRALSAATW